MTQSLLETSTVGSLLSKECQEFVGGPRHAEELPSGRAKKEQAEIQLVLRKGIQKSGGGWPRNSRIRKFIQSSTWSWRRKNNSLFPLGLILMSLLYLHLTFKSHRNLELC